MLDPIRLKIKGDALFLSVFSAALALFFAFQTACPAEGATITVTNNTEVINGDTTGPEALTDNPGPDGISLPEAMWAALSKPGPHTIHFTPSLKGTTIAVTGFLPSLSSGLITIDGSPVDMEILGGVGSGAQGNRVHHVSILDNTLGGGGIQLVGGQGSNAAQNSIDTVFIGRNRVSNAAANGLFFVGGSDGASNNEITNATVFNNCIAGSRDAGILLHGHDGFTPNNIIEGVNIFNNTIVANGNSWAGGININTKSATNIITGVKISNTILWNNAGYDVIRGSESPESVGCSVLNDSRYVGNDGNFYASPEFVDPAGGDYHLSASSPCVDRGDNSAVAGIDTDIDHDPRVVDGDKRGTAIVDIGCDEYLPEIPRAGDINGDGRVDLADAILALRVLVEKAAATAAPMETLVMLRHPARQWLTAGPAKLGFANDRYRRTQA